MNRFYRVRSILKALLAFFAAVFFAPSIIISAPYTESDWEVVNKGGIAGTNGLIYTQVCHKGKLYVGGDFTTVGTIRANGIAMWDGNRWNALGAGVSPHHGKYNDGTPSVYDGVVKAIVVDSQENVYVGGAFDSAGGIRVNNIARWDGTKWNALGPGTNWEVTCIAFDKNGYLCIGGGFSMVGSDSAGIIEKWDGMHWSAVGKKKFGENGEFMCVDNKGNVYMGGTWPYQNYFLMKWDGAVLDTVWEGITRWIAKTMAIDSAGNLFIGGVEYDRGVGWILKQNGSKWTIFDTLHFVTTCSVNALAFDRNGALYVGGDFRIIGKTPASNIARWDGAKWNLLEENTGGAKANLFEAGTNGAVYSLVFNEENKLFVAGAFSQTTYTTTGNIAVWDGQNFKALNKGNTSSDVIHALAADNRGNLYVGGIFSTIGGIVAPNIAKWDGSNWTAFDSNPRGTVSALVSDKNGNLYVSGDFDTIGDLVTHRIAKWDGNTWSSLGAGLNGYIYSLVMDNNQILYAGGYISSDSQNVAQWNGIKWEMLPGKLPEIYTLAVDNKGALYAGGRDKYLRKWDGVKWDTSFGDSKFKQIQAIAIDSAHNIYVGGIAGSGDDTTVVLSKWDGLRWKVMARGDGVNFMVINAINCDNKGNVYVGGNLWNENDAPLGTNAKWDGKKWEPLGNGVRNNRSSPYINKTLLKDSLLYVGGSFFWAGDKISPIIARVNVHNSGDAKVIMSKPHIKKHLRFHLAQTSLLISDILPHDRIALFSLSGRSVRSVEGSHRVDLKGLAPGPLLIQIHRGGLVVSTGMVMVP